MFLKTYFRYTKYLLFDLLDYFIRVIKRKDYLPPRSLRDSVGNYKDFEATGIEFFNYFRKFCDLKPDEKILDVGCGCGRMAIPLTKYLDKKGSYEGFDIVSRAIDWCVKNISSNYPNFHFELSDVFNKSYNPKGKHKASEYKFPYENESFDFVFLTSIFTHMLPQDMENYFCEINRLLKRNGRCLITFFLLNKESLQLINARKSTLDFKYEFGEYRTIDINTLESAVCYDEAFVLSLYEKIGLKIKQPIRYGSWCSRSNFLSYQDIIIALKGVNGKLKEPLYENRSLWIQV
ncbi:MAG: class I SAM-dependent methyltransferase [Syntrophales bacterium]|nr:class I SAM-dependent methyltransferase [Syntrophales bacterium]